MASAQDPPIPPFYSVYGGLFFPSDRGFRSTYNSASNFVWGMGLGLPVSADFMYLTADLSWFRAEGFTSLDPDTGSEVSYKFIHAGILSKHFLSTSVAIRVQAGVNYNSVERKIRPAGGEEIRNEVSRKPGFYGGAGLEKYMGGGAMSIFVDFLYDYRRSTDREIYGDFGGYRIVMGASVYWF
jgi:hypothetical protein